jgi:tRNA modification GTPase
VSYGAYDTIVAPATPPGRSALAIVRIDGPLSGAILERLSSGPIPAERAVSHRRLIHLGEVLEDCVAVRYVSPRSYTGNDLVELTLHGNPFLVERVCRACVELGARLAQPGEFTERAVLNGKIDLIQAESISDLINARTALQARLSLSNLEGTLSRGAMEMRESLLFVISRLEAALDFSEEGYEFISRGDAQERVERAIGSARALSETYQRGRATVRGLDAVILGRPNAGKSTLLNRLVGSDRAIVTEFAGTTRDILRETVEIGGLPVTFADTAGLRLATDVVERIGIERARAAATQADIVLYLIDSGTGLTAEDEAELVKLPDAIVIYTKSDLVAPPAGAHGISALAGEGMPELLTLLDSQVQERFASGEGALVNERQRLAVADCESALQAAADSLFSGREEQIILVDLYRAANSLGTLTGAISRDEIYTEIFSRFCIGK